LVGRLRAAPLRRSPDGGKILQKSSRYKIAFAFPQEQALYADG
jgi:hypothetical protein